MKAKLYSTRTGWLNQYNTLFAHFGLGDGEKWCAEMKVEDGGEHDGKWIIPLPEAGTFRADNLVSGAISYDYGWHGDPPTE